MVNCTPFNWPYTLNQGLRHDWRTYHFRGYRLNRWERKEDMQTYSPLAPVPHLPLIIVPLSNTSCFIVCYQWFGFKFCFHSTIILKYSSVLMFMYLCIKFMANLYHHPWILLRMTWLCCLALQGYVSLSHTSYPNLYCMNQMIFLVVDGYIFKLYKKCNFRSKTTITL